MNDLTNAASPSPLEREIIEIRTLVDGDDFDAALGRLQPLLEIYSENRDLLLLKANCERFLRRTAESLATLDKLAALHPNFSLMYQERGLCHVARKDGPAALEALQRAVTINPALPLSWQMIEGVARIAGDQTLAALAATHRASLASIPDIVVEATSLFSDGDIAPAENMVRAFLLQVGDDPEAMRRPAKIGLVQTVYDNAELPPAGG